MEERYVSPSKMEEEDNPRPTFRSSKLEKVERNKASKSTGPIHVDFKNIESIEPTIDIKGTTSFCLPSNFPSIA